MLYIATRSKHKKTSETILNSIVRFTIIFEIINCFN